MSDIKEMQLGQVVDFCITYNKRQAAAEESQTRPRKRKANQNDINTFFG